MYGSRIIRVGAILGLLAAAFAGNAHAQALRVVVVPGLQAHDLRTVATRGAVGLLVPGAGPETSARAAAVMLAQGVVRNSLRGAPPAGPVRIRVEQSRSIPTGGRFIVLGLPQGGAQPNNRRYTPYVVETSVGADRTTLAVLVNAFHEETVEGEDEGRTVLKLLPSLAPVKAGIFPLVKKDGMPEMAHRIAEDLRPLYPVFYDESGAIGRRYRRQDEIGTPFGITVDGESIAEGTVTIRDRDTLQQERVQADQLRSVLQERLTK